MSIAHDDNNLIIQSAFICVLTEALDYESPQLAYEAYRLANLNLKRPIQDLGIKLSGLLLPNDIETCEQLVDEIDFRVNVIDLGIQYFLATIQGNHKLLSNPSDESLYHRCVELEISLDTQNENSV